MSLGKTISQRLLTLCRIFLISGSLSVLAAADSQQLSVFPFMRSAIPPASGSAAAPVKGELAIVLDQEFYSHIQDLNSDLQIVNQQDVKIPFALHQRTAAGEIFREEQLSGRIVREQQLPDGRSAVDFELSDGNAPVAAVEISGSGLASGMVLSIAVGDGNTWQNAVNQLKLSDISMLPEITTRRFPLARPLAGKTVRLILSCPAFPKLEAVRVYTLKSQQQPNAPVTQKHQLTRHGERQTPEALTVVLNANNLPLIQLRITSGLPHYYHRLTVSGSNDNRNWQLITSAAIRKIDMDKVETVDFPESRYKYLQLQIADPGKTTAGDLHIEAVANSYQWLIPDEPATRQPLTIYFGAANSEVIRRENASDPAVNGTFRLTAPAANSLRKTGVEDRSSWPYLLGAVLVFLTGIVTIWALLELKRSSAELPAD